MSIYGLFDFYKPQSCTPSIVECIVDSHQCKGSIPSFGYIHLLFLFFIMQSLLHSIVHVVS